MENLVALDLRHSKLEEVWQVPKFLGSLKILNLSYSERLLKTPNFMGLQNLERLILKGCGSLIEICESFEFLEVLDLLDLTDCKNLRKLPRNIYKLGSLETLIMSGCSTLFTRGYDISATSTANGQGKWWRTSLLLPRVPEPSRGLEMLWASLPHSLTSLDLSWCNLYDESLPREFGNLSSIKDLCLRGNPFHSLPDCITSLSSLQSLELYGCDSLDSISGLPSNIRKLDVNCCSSLRKMTFQSTPHQLRDISMLNSHKVIEIEGFLKIEPLVNVDERIIKNLGIDIESIKNLEVYYSGKWIAPIPGQIRATYECGIQRRGRIQVQGFYESNIFSTFIPGGEIPNGFTEGKKGSVVSFTVPSDRRIQCFNICHVYARPVWRENEKYSIIIGIFIHNKTKDLKWMYYPMFCGNPEGDEDMTWLSRWNLENRLEGGYEIEVSFSKGYSFAKKCGIKIVYEEDNGVVSNDNNKTYFPWKKQKYYYHKNYELVESRIHDY